MPQASRTIAPLSTSRRAVWSGLLARTHGDVTAYHDYRDRYPRNGHRAGLRGTHEVGRGDAMTAALLPPSF